MSNFRPYSKFSPKTDEFSSILEKLLTRIEPVPVCPTKMEERISRQDRPDVRCVSYPLHRRGDGEGVLTC